MNIFDDDRVISLMMASFSLGIFIGMSIHRFFFGTRGKPITYWQLTDGKYKVEFIEKVSKWSIKNKKSYRLLVRAADDLTIEVHGPKTIFVKIPDYMIPDNMEAGSEILINGPRINLANITERKI